MPVKQALGDETTSVFFFFFTVVELLSSCLFFIFVLESASSDVDEHLRWFYSEKLGISV